MHAVRLGLVHIAMADANFMSRKLGTVETCSKTKSSQSFRSK